MSYSNLIEDMLTVYSKNPLFEDPLDFNSDDD